MMAAALSGILIALPMSCFQAMMLEWLNCGEKLTSRKSIWGGIRILPEKRGENVPDRRRFLVLSVLFLAFSAAVVPKIGNRLLPCAAAEAALIAFFSFLFYPGNYIRAGRAAARLWLCVQILHGASRLILVLIQSHMSQAVKPFLLDMLEKNICNLLLYLLFVAVKIYIERKNRQKFILVTFISCFFAVGQIIFYYYLFLLNPAELTQRVVGAASISSMVILFVHGATLELMGRIVENQKLQNETEKKMLEKKYEYDYYLLAEEQTRAIRKIRTDMWSQLKVVEELMQGKEEAKKEAEDILGRLEDEVNHIGRVYYCEDAVLNTILSLKQEKAKKLGIEMNIKVDSTVKTEAEDIDLCCIVTNLLDNAIESAERVLRSGAKGGKEIKVHVGHRGGYLIMKVENAALSAPVKNKKGGYKTSKQGGGKSKYHGRGLNIVEKTVEKYSGRLDMKKEGDKFTVTVFLKEKTA